MTSCTSLKICKKQVLLPGPIVDKLAVVTNPTTLVIVLFQRHRSKKLPDLLTPPQKSEKNEDTFSHGALDAVLSVIFPENDSEITFSWANRPCRGSRERRGDPHKPDITIVKQTSDVGFGEIKAPKDDRCMRFFLEDEWALLSLAKDTIDLHVRESRGIVRIALLQVFGKILP
jgi:hypothetical protein